MKIINKPIQMVVWFDENGLSNPVRFRIQNEDESYNVIKIDKVLIREKEKLAGNPMFIFICKSYINNNEKIYEIKFEINTSKWVLWKM